MSGEMFKMKRSDIETSFSASPKNNGKLSEYNQIKSENEELRRSFCINYDSKTFYNPNWTIDSSELNVISMKIFRALI